MKSLEVYGRIMREAIQDGKLRTGCRGGLGDLLICECRVSPVLERQRYRKSDFLSPRAGIYISIRTWMIVLNYSGKECRNGG